MLGGVFVVIIVIGLVGVINVGLLVVEILSIDDL